MKYDVAIIGGGLSGLSAAVDLTSCGYSVLLLEQRQFLGGRAYSFIDEVTGDVVDNGQHLMMGCYKETRWLLKTIGSDHLATLQPNLHIDFLHPQKGISSLSCPNLPAPFHILFGMLGLRTVPIVDRMKLLKVGLQLQRNPASIEPELATMTVDEWMTKLGQSEENKKYLWNIIAIGTLNDDPRTVSALLFYRVLRTAFLGAKENSSMLIPRAGLSQLFAEPAVEYLRLHGSEVQLNSGVEKMLSEGDTIRGAHCEGIDREAKAYISAVPYYAIDALFEEGKQNGYAEKFDSSPIITINIWLDRVIIQQEFLALLDSPIQWIFNKTKIYGKAALKGQYLSLVTSGAAEYVELTKEQLVAMAFKELQKAIPLARQATIRHSLVMKEKRATFSPKPGVEAHRPSAQTRFKNCFLAGDWTNTGFPATIEGAVMSGKTAARETIKFLRA